MSRNIKILAIETSCDETAAAVIEERTIFGSQTKSGMTGFQPVILSNIISSQIDLHAKTGGVVPEVASRAHMEAITPVISLALIKAGQNINHSPLNTQINEKCEMKSGQYQEAIELMGDITHIAVTAGPGLIGSLLVGFNAGKTLAYARNLPIIPINHIEGHIYSALKSREISKSEFLMSKQIPNFKSQVQKESKILNTKYCDLPEFPVLALTVSGGHTSLTLMKDHGVYEKLGETLDDAVGEAYDKVAKLLGLGYPGGPVISKLAGQLRNKFSIFNFQFSDSTKAAKLPINNNSTIVFPRPIIDDGTFNFSFSGLKTAVLVWVKKYMQENGLDSPEKISLAVKEKIAAAFEEAVKDVLVSKTVKAARKFQPSSVIFAGGVSANEFLRNSLDAGLKSLDSGIQFLTPSQGLFGDNAAMIGVAAYYHIKRGTVKKWSEISVDSNLEIA